MSVERALRPKGVPQPALVSLVRAGGQATTADEYVKVSTRWRVRRDVAAADDADAGTLADAGRLVTEGGQDDSEPGALVDEGVAGSPLYQLCTELDAAATERERLDCLRDERTLVNVPAGISPLAAQLVPIGAAMGPPKYFAVHPAAHTSILEVAARAGTETENGLAVSSTFIHVVGRQVLTRDRDGNGVLEGAELSNPPPDFTELPDTIGLPKKAIDLHAVYTARLKPEAGGPVRRVPSIDRVREHRFDVVSIESATVEKRTGAVIEELPQDATDPQAEEGDDGNDLLLGLLQAPPPENRGLTEVGTHEVRLGDDAYGLTCDIDITQVGATNAIGGTCEGATLDEVISAHDVLYIEMFLSGNSDNVLYRYNLYGTKQRIDHLVAGSDFTAEKAVADVVLASNEIVQPPRAATSQLNRALFFIDPVDMKTGTLRVCKNAR